MTDPTELTPDEIAELHRLLLRLKEDLQHSLQEGNEGTRPVSLDEPIGRLSRMEALQQQHMALAGQRALQNRLHQVEAALHRHRQGEYGLCTLCEEPIRPARLKARPETPFCLSCQGRREGKT